MMPAATIATEATTFPVQAGKITAINVAPR